jgi:hypothetical protein
MSAAKHKILPPGTVLSVLDPLVSFDEKKFNLLKLEIGGPKGFNFDQSRISKLADPLELSTSHLEALISVLDGLYLRTSDILSDGAEINEALGEFVDRIKSDDEKYEASDDQVELLKSRLIDLISSNYESINNSKKIERLKDGFLKNAVGVGSFVDLRPNFTEDLEKINGWIATVQFRITTDSNIALDREIVFQCDQSSLVKLKAAIEKAEKKLKTMMNAAENNGLEVVKEIGHDQ